jgi:hypothetical protein
MNRLLVFATIVAVLAAAGQLYLHSRRRRASRLFGLLARKLGVSRRGNRIQFAVGNHRVILDAQVTRDDRPEELRLRLDSTLPGAFRLTLPAAATRYDDCRHREPASPGTPFAGWHARSEDTALLAALAADRGVRQLLDRLADLGFTRFELENGKLAALWPDFPWSLKESGEKPEDANAFPGRLRRAAEALSNLAAAAGAALLCVGRTLRGSRVRSRLAALFAVPLLLMIAGTVAAFWLYDRYPTLRDEELLAFLAAAGILLAVPYAVMAWRLLDGSIQRGARTAVIGLVACFGFCPGLTAPVLWWNGSRPQAPGRPVTVEVIKTQKDDAMTSIRGRLLGAVAGRDSPLVTWGTTYRAIVKSWRDGSRYGISLTREQFQALPTAGGRLSFTVHPGALGIEWYSGVAADPNPRELEDAGGP